MATSKKKHRLTWDGDTTSDGRYQINRIVGGGRTEFYLSVSPLYVTEERPRVEMRPVPMPVFDATPPEITELENVITTVTSGEYEEVQVGVETVAVVDETPLPCGTLDEAKAQAQAIDDGELEAFEHARQSELRAQRAERAAIAAEAEGLVAYARRVDADDDLTAAALKRRRKAVIVDAERHVKMLQAMFAAQYEEKT